MHISVLQLSGQAPVPLQVATARFVALRTAVDFLFVSTVVVVDGAIILAYVALRAGQEALIYAILVASLQTRQFHLVRGGLMVDD